MKSRVSLPSLLGGLLSVGLVLTSTALGLRSPRPAAARPMPQINYGSLPLHFEANRGQVNPQVQFLSRGSGYGLFLAPTEAVLTLQKSAPEPSQLGPSVSPAASERATVRMQVVGGNPEAAGAGVKPLPGKTNYLRGNDPAKWQRNVPNYRQVRYEEVYPGIDLLYYGNQRRLEYDFVVAPGADPEQIRLEFRGMESARLEQGELVLATAGGELRQHRPVVYQEVAGQRREVAGEYRLAEGMEEGVARVSFALGEYDRTQPLVIDPLLSYATFLGGLGLEHGTAIAVDALGQAYVTGNVPSPGTGFPATPGAYDETPNGVSQDIFLAKLNAEGSDFLYATYLSGTGSEEATGIAVTGEDACVVGSTSSTNYPTTASALSQVREGPVDGFLTRLSADGSSLVYSTYLGGDSSDRATDAAVSTAGRIYVTGHTGSSDFPLVNPLPGTGGIAFLTIFNANNTLYYSTKIPGTTFASSVGVDGAGAAYVAGRATSGLPVTPGAYQTTPSQLYLAKIGADGALAYCTYLPTLPEWDSPTGPIARVAVDSAGFAYTAAGHLFSFGENNLLEYYRPIIVQKFNQAGTQELFRNTQVSGAVLDIAADATGHACVASYLYSGSPAPLVNPWLTNGSPLVAKLLADGSNLEFCTQTGGFLGGAVAVDSEELIYVTGTVSHLVAESWPTVRPAQPEFGGVTDAFILRIGSDLLVPPAAPSNLQARKASDQRIDLFWQDNSYNEHGFLIERCLTSGSPWVEIGRTFHDKTTFIDGSAAPNTFYLYRVAAYNSTGNSAYSPSSIGTTAAPRPPINPLAVAVHPATIVLGWTDDSDNESGFPIEVSTDGENFTRFTTAAASAGTGTRRLYQHTNRTPGVRYYYRVCASNSYGSSTYTPVVSAVTDVLPAAPTGLTVEALSTTQLRLSWTDASSNEASFALERSTDGTNFTRFTTAAASAGTGTVRTYTNGGLQSGKQYWYRVAASNVVGSSPYSNVASARTFGPPAAPSGLQVVSPQAGKLRLEWTDQASDESGFVIDYSTDGVSYTRLTGVTASPGVGGVKSYTHSGLAAGQRYWYRVAAWNSYGLSAFVQGPGTIAQPLPAAPSGLQASVPQAGKIRLDWTDHASNESGFVIDYSTDGVNFTRLTGAGASAGEGGVKSYTHTGLTVGQQYWYRVAAWNAAGLSAFTNVASAVP